jgi:hypothetical protein
MLHRADVLDRPDGRDPGPFDAPVAMAHRPVVGADCRTHPVAAAAAASAAERPVADLIGATVVPGLQLQAEFAFPNRKTVAGTGERALFSSAFAAYIGDAGSAGYDNKLPSQ